MAMKCTRCGTLLVPGTQSCPGCGQQFASPVPADPAPQAAPPPANSPYGTPPQANSPYGAPPANAPYGSPPPANNPYGGTPPQQGAPYQTPPAYGANQPYGTPPNTPPYGQAPKSSNKTTAWIVIAVAVVGIGTKVLTQLGKDHPSTPTTPVTSPADPSTPTTPVTTPTSPSTPSSGGDDDVTGLATNMTSFGHCLEEFGRINTHPKFGDPQWEQEMAQNVQQMEDDIAAEKQVNWPSQYLPAKANYEGGLAEYKYLADHWVDAIKQQDTATLEDCDTHAKKGNDLLAQAEAQIKQISGSS